MRYDSPEVEKDYVNSRFENPRMHWFLFVMDQLALAKFGVDICVTSMWTGRTPADDPYGLHRAKRAADVRIYHPARDGRNGTRRAPEVTRPEMIMLATDLNRAFKYGLTGRGKPTETVKVRLASAGHHADDMNDHAHVQFKTKGPWA